MPPSCWKLDPEETFTTEPEPAVEVEEVSFEQRRIGVFVERGTSTEVDGTVTRRSVGVVVPTGIDPVGRQAHPARNRDVGGREPEQPAALGVGLATAGKRPVVVVGDGAFQMTGQELSTMVRRGLSPVVFRA